MDNGNLSYLQSPAPEEVVRVLARRDRAAHVVSHKRQANLEARIHPPEAFARYIGVVCALIAVLGIDQVAQFDRVESR